MRGPAGWFFSIAALWLVWAVPCAAQGPSRDLHCENATNPRGVKTPHPQLSWAVPSPRAPRAYQILVASSEEKLKADEGDLWDSGRVMSDGHTARYQGKPLASLQRCYWKVRVWNDYDTANGYSDTANWQMGVMSFDGPEGK